MSRFDIHTFFERQERLLPFSKLAADIERFQKLVPNFDHLNIASTIPKGMQTAIDNANLISKNSFLAEAAKLSASVYPIDFPDHVKASLDRVNAIPSTNLMSEVTKLNDAYTLSVETQRAIDKAREMNRAIDRVNEMQRAIDLVANNHLNRIADLTKTLGVNDLSSISQSLALKAAEIEFAYSDIAEFSGDEIESAIDRFSDEGFIENTLDSINAVKDSRDFTSLGLAIILFLLSPFYNIWLMSLIESNEMDAREVKRELRNNSHYYREEYNDSNFRVITKNGVRLRTEPRRVEETILFELPAFTGVTIIERPSGRTPWVKVSLVLDGVKWEGWVAARYLQKIR